MKTNQKGFGILPVIVVVLVLGVAGFAGWKVWATKNKNETKATAQNTPVVSEEKAAPQVKLKEYRDSVAGFTVKYPDSWTVNTTNGNQGGGDYPTTDTRIKSPHGTVLVLNVNYGGKGGNCEPEPGDRPHMAGNACPTSEYLSLEPLSQTVMQQMEAGYKEVPLILATKKFTDPKGATSYVIGLHADQQSSFFAKLNDPHMGAIPYYMFVSLPGKNGRNSSNFSEAFKYNFEAYATSKDSNFLNNDEGKAVKEILRSINLAQ